jgi:hypothetical protein
MSPINNDLLKLNAKYSKCQKKLVTTNIPVMAIVYQEDSTHLTLLLKQFKYQTSQAQAEVTAVQPDALINGEIRNHDPIAKLHRKPKPIAQLRKRDRDLIVKEVSDVLLDPVRVQSALSALHRRTDVEETDEVIRQVARRIIEKTDVTNRKTQCQAFADSSFVLDLKESYLTHCDSGA